MCYIFLKSASVKKRQTSHRRSVGWWLVTYFAANCNFPSKCTKISQFCKIICSVDEGGKEGDAIFWKTIKKIKHTKSNKTYRVGLTDRLAAANKITSGWAKAARPREPKDRASERASESVKPHFGLCSPPTKLLRVEQLIMKEKKENIVKLLRYKINAN